MKQRVLLIDDHTLFRAGLEDLLTRRGIDVVASVANGIDGIRLVSEQLIDIVLLDVRMPEMTGMCALRRIQSIKPDLPVVMLTTSCMKEDFLEALRAGAQGYLLKDMEPDELVVAIGEVIQGKIIVAPDLRPILASAIKDGKVTTTKNPFGCLTPREHEILLHLSEGQSNKAIARSLGISDGTVKLHVKSILRKLGISSRITAAVMAVEYGLKYGDG